MQLKNLYKMWSPANTKSKNKAINLTNNKRQLILTNMSKEHSPSIEKINFNEEFTDSLITKEEMNNQWNRDIKEIMSKSDLKKNSNVKKINIKIPDQDLFNKVVFK